MFFRIFLNISFMILYLLCFRRQWNRGVDVGSAARNGSGTDLQTYIGETFSKKNIQEENTLLFQLENWENFLELKTNLKLHLKNLTFDKAIEICIQRSLTGEYKIPLQIWCSILYIICYWTSPHSDWLKAITLMMITSFSNLQRYTAAILALI